MTEWFASVRCSSSRLEAERSIDVGHGTYGMSVNLGTIWFSLQIAKLRRHLLLQDWSIVSLDQSSFISHLHLPAKLKLAANEIQQNFHFAYICINFLEWSHGNLDQLKFPHFIIEPKCGTFEILGRNFHIFLHSNIRLLLKSLRLCTIIKGRVNSWLGLFSVYW